MVKREIVKKLRESAKGLLDLARELQLSERAKSPRALEIVERNVRAKDCVAQKFALPFVVGVDDFGNDVVLELAHLPHVLIGGATGQGKTECLNSLIAGLIATKTPDEVRFVVFDPKCVEYVGLADLPHLIAPPVTSSQEMVAVIRWLESEVDKRLQMFASVRCRNISEFNGRTKSDEFPKTFPCLVAVFDEIADLMRQAGREVEPILCRLTAIARAAGVHLVFATVRPDEKVVPEALKANVPGRIVFKTANSADSMTLIDDVGAEDLLGGGDFMLRTGFSEIVRGQGAQVSYDETAALVEAAIERYGSVKYDENILSGSLCESA